METNSNNNLDNIDDICDLDNSKICDNCGKCLDDYEKDFRIVRVDGIIKDEKFKPDFDEYLFEENLLEEDSDALSNDDIVYIEDIPSLKEKYDHEIDEILGREEDDCE